MNQVETIMRLADEWADQCGGYDSSHLAETSTKRKALLDALNEVLGSNNECYICGNEYPCPEHGTPEWLKKKNCDSLSDFQEGQWWLKELDAMAMDGTPDQKRAVAVVRNLMNAAKALHSVDTPYGHVTTHSVTGQQFFYRYPEHPYLDNASECVKVYVIDRQS